MCVQCSVIFHFYTHNCCLDRNFQNGGEGSVQEIGFEEFLIVMSYFRAPSVHMTEEQREDIRRTKLRCKNAINQSVKLDKHDVGNNTT